MNTLRTHRSLHDSEVNHAREALFYPARHEVAGNVYPMPLRLARRKLPKKDAQRRIDGYLWALLLALPPLLYRLWIVT